MVFRSTGIKSHLYMRGELQIKKSKYARKDSRNSELDRLIKKIDLEDEENELV